MDINNFKIKENRFNNKGFKDYGDIEKKINNSIKKNLKENKVKVRDRGDFDLNKLTNKKTDENNTDLNKNNEKHTNTRIKTHEDRPSYNIYSKNDYKPNKTDFEEHFGPNKINFNAYNNNTVSKIYKDIIKRDESKYNNKRNETNTENTTNVYSKFRLNKRLDVNDTDLNATRSLSVKNNEKNINMNQSEIKKDKHNNTIDRLKEIKSKDLKFDLNKDNSKEFKEDESEIPQTTKSKAKTPLIKTIITNETTKYKTVTFTEKRQKKKLNIRIPNIPSDRRTKIPKLITKTHKIINNTDDKAVNKKTNKGKRKRDVVSPIYKRGGSPFTEVAKWAPNSINELTKPYYEAWVTTTLAATTRGDMDREKKEIIRNFQKALEQRSKSPELMYQDFTDERFIGRIKINHKSRL